MALKLHTLYAAAAALIAAGSAAAAGFMPDYIGTDYGIARYGARVYAGYALGSEPLFGTETKHYLELMGYSLGYDGDLRQGSNNKLFRDFTRVNGVAFNWATSTRMSDKWSANTRIGVDVLHARTYKQEGEQVRSWDNVSGLASAGLAYAVDRHWDVRADMNYMPIKVSGNPNPRANALTTGLAYKF